MRYSTKERKAIQYHASIVYLYVHNTYAATKRVKQKVVMIFNIALSYIC